MHWRVLRGSFHHVNKRSQFHSNARTSMHSRFFCIDPQSPPLRPSRRFLFLHITIDTVPLLRSAVDCTFLRCYRCNESTRWDSRAASCGLPVIWFSARRRKRKLSLVHGHFELPERLQYFSSLNLASDMAAVGGLAVLPTITAGYVVKAFIEEAVFH